MSGESWIPGGGDSDYGGGDTKAAGRRSVIVTRGGWSTPGEHRMHAHEQAKAKAARRRKTKAAKTARKANR